MLVLNFGLPRSGTVWTNAVIRQVLSVHKAPHRSLNSAPDTLEPLLARVVENGIHRWRNLVIHMHDWSPGVAALVARAEGFVVAFANHRDPRDVCVSLARLHDRPIADMIGLTRHYVAMQAPFRAATGASCLGYEAGRADPAGFVDRVADGLALPLPAGERDRIVAETSVDSHRRRMQEVAEGRTEAVREISNRRRVLRECAKTHINDRHIQSGESGRWQRELSPEERAMVRDGLAGAVAELGYEA